MTTTFGGNIWSPRNAWNFQFIRNGALIPRTRDDGDDRQSEAETVAEWKRAAGLVIRVLEQGFPDALAAVREALAAACEAEKRRSFTRPDPPDGAERIPSPLGSVSWLCDDSPPPPWAK